MRAPRPPRGCGRRRPTPRPPRPPPPPPRRAANRREAVAAARASASRTPAARASGGAAPSARSAATARPALCAWCAPSSAGGGSASSPAPSRKRSAPEPSSASRTSHSWPQTASSQPTSAARARSAPSAAGGCAPTTARTPGRRMPAFSAAIAATVRPRKASWSRLTGAMTQSAGCSAATLVASRRPPIPTSSSVKSAGSRANASSAAHVVASKSVIGAPPFTSSTSRSSAVSSVLADGAAAERDPLVEGDEVRARVRVHALARRLQRRAHERNRRALAIGARHVDDGRQIALRLAERLEQPLDAAEAEVDRRRVQCGKAGERGVARGGRHRRRRSSRARAPRACELALCRLRWRCGTVNSATRRHAAAAA